MPRRLAISAFVLCSLVALAAFFIPAVIIQPFKHQAPDRLLLAMQVKQYAPTVSLTAAGLALLMLLFLWSGARLRVRVLLACGLLVSVASATMTRLNYFEWMFHPVTGGGFESAGTSKLAGSEMVMAVHFSADARAYPIVQMAYHHAFNDTVGGVPIVVTY